MHLIDDNQFITYIYWHMYVCVYMFVQKHIAHGNFTTYFFPVSFWNRLAHSSFEGKCCVLCAKSNTCLAFCRFRSRRRRAKYWLTCIYFLLSKDKRNKGDFLKIMSYPLLHPRCQLFSLWSFIHHENTLEQSEFLPAVSRVSLLFCSLSILSWPWLARCDSSFCGWSECMCLTGWPERRGRCETLNCFLPEPWLALPCIWFWTSDRIISAWNLRIILSKFHSVIMIIMGQR